MIHQVTAGNILPLQGLAHSHLAIQYFLMALASAVLFTDFQLVDQLCGDYNCRSSGGNGRRLKEFFSGLLQDKSQSINASLLFGLQVSNKGEWE